MKKSENAGFFPKKSQKFGGSDGTRTRGLWRDRPVTNGGFLRHFQLFNLHLPTFTYNDLHKKLKVAGWLRRELILSDEEEVTSVVSGLANIGKDRCLVGIELYRAFDLLEQAGCRQNLTRTR